jgi:hypothetical protein
MTHSNTDLRKEIEDILLLEPIIDKYKHTILNIPDVAKELEKLISSKIVAELNLLDEALFPHPYKRINFTKLKEYKADRIAELEAELKGGENG